MQVCFVTLGRIRDASLRALLNDYYKRLNRYARFEEIELKDADQEQIVRKVSKLLSERDRVVALEVEGQSLSSKALADYLGRAELESVQRVVFLIGGAYGLPAELSAQADLKLSLSAFTLPHRLARLFLAEQVYRAFTIHRGEPYDH